MRITFLGHSCFYIESGDTRIVIDPYYDEYRFNIKPTHVIATHGHGDHLGNSEELCKKFDALFISNFEVANHLTAKGVKDTHPMHIGGFVDFKQFKLKMVQAFHSSSIDGLTNVGAATGLIINIEGKNLYHAGDTGLFGDMELIGKRHPIDIAFLPIGGNFTMDIDDAAYATKLINPKTVVPMHYNTFPVIEQNPEEFAEQVKDISECAIFDLGDTKEF